MRLIELSTAFFYSGHAPRELALRDCSFPMPQAPASALCVLYGVQGKQDGFIGARAYAERKNLQFTVIDLVVGVENQNPLPMKSEDLASCDFLNFRRMSTALGREVTEWLTEALSNSGAGRTRLAALVASESSMNAIAQRPALLDLLIEHPDFEHLKVIVFPALTEVSDRPLNIGSIPHRHWTAITDATCRLDRTIHITLEPPSLSPAASPRKRVRKAS